MRWQLLDCPLVEADVTTHPDYINKFLLPHHLLRRSRYIDFDLKLNNCLWSWFHPRRINVRRYEGTLLNEKIVTKSLLSCCKAIHSNLNEKYCHKFSIFMHIMVVKWSFYSLFTVTPHFFAKRIFYQWNKLCFFSPSHLKYLNLDNSLQVQVTVYISALRPYIKSSISHDFAGNWKTLT